MSGETEKSVSGWTVDTLKEYVEQRFTDSDRAVQAALVSQEKAIVKAETATEKRFESVNEFRAQLTDQTNSFIPRPEYDAQHRALVDKVADLTDRLNVADGRTTGSDLTTSKMIAIVSVSVGVLGLIITLVVLIANGKL